MNRGQGGIYRVYPRKQEIYKRSPEQPDNVPGTASEILLEHGVRRQLQWLWLQPQRLLPLLPVRQE